MSQLEKITITVALPDALDELSVDMRTDPTDAVERILDVALSYDAAFARAMLRVKRRVARVSVAA